MNPIDPMDEGMQPEPQTTAPAVGETVADPSMDVMEGDQPADLAAEAGIRVYPREGFEANAPAKIIAKVADQIGALVAWDGEGVLLVGDDHDQLLADALRASVA